MKKALLCGLVCVFALATTAQADISLSWTVSQESGMWKAIGTLTTTGGKIDAIDLGTPGAPGITGQLYQDWVSGILPTPAADTVIGDSPAVDSHFLFSTSDLTVPAGRELKEDNGGSNPSVGTYLGGTFGLAPGVQATTLDFVQLYIPLDGGAAYAFEASEAGVGKVAFQGNVPVPEPSMIILLGLGSMAMVLVRRR